MVTPLAATGVRVCLGSEEGLRERPRELSSVDMRRRVARSRTVGCRSLS